MLEPEVFRKQMCCIEESTGDIVGIFRRSSAVTWRPIVIRRPGNCVPPRYAPDCAVLCWNLAQQLTSCVTPVVIKQTSEKRLLLLIQVWLSVLIKYGTGLTIALEVDDMAWMWNRTRLCQLTGKQALHRVTFYAIQLSVLSPRQKDFVACLRLKVAKKTLWNSWYSQHVGGWTYLLV